jgi:hypothetical protein
MNKKSEPLLKIDPVQQKQVKKPDETGSVYIESHVKIFDPNTKEVFVEKRA